MRRERRKHKRHYLTASAAITIKNQEDAPPLETLVANISKIGLGVYAEKPFEKDTPVSIKITFKSDDGRLQTDSIGGSIVSSSEIGDVYFIGIVFDEELNKKKHDILFRHLRRIFGWY